MALADLCSLADVQSRMADPGLATATTEESDNEEVITRKITQATGEIELELLSRIQKALAPNQTNSHGQDAATILTKLYNRTILKQCAIVWTIYAMLEEGEARMRFMHENAGDTISRMLDRWRKDKQAAMDTAWPLIRFDFDDNGTITPLESSFTNTFSSIRITA